MARRGVRVFDSAGSEAEVTNPLSLKNEPVVPVDSSDFSSDLPSEVSPRDQAKLVAADLASATDELNAALNEAERGLVDLNLGVSASVELFSDEPWSEYLVFGKIGNVWKLHVSAGDTNDPDGPSWSSTPILNASRASRVEAASLLPKLLEQLIATAQEHLATVKNETLKVRSFAASIQKKGGK